MSSEPVEVNLVVSGVDLEDDATADILALHLDDLLWTEFAGVVIATVFAESDPVGAALDAAQRIHAALPTAAVSRVQPDLVTITAIAARVGVSRQAVRQWVTGRSASAPFPMPYAVLEPEDKPLKIWRWAEIVPWLREVKGLSFEPLPTPAQVAAIDARLSSTPGPAAAGARHSPRLASTAPPHLRRGLRCGSARKLERDESGREG